MTGDGRRESPHGERDVKTTGMGHEAARGIHGADADVREDDPNAKPETGRSRREGAERAGSEPLTETDQIHKGGYGGEGGEPRTSSDQRKPADS